LVVDARTVLEPSSEEPLVRRERTVEILHGQADVMERARRFHAAIVCERLAPKMRVSALALVLATMALAGCGGGKKAEQPNAEASKPANRVLADAVAAARSARSVHVSGHIVSNGTPITLDLTLERNKGATGSMSTQGLSFDLVRIGRTFYIRGSDAFWKHFAGAGVAQLMHGKWLKGTTTGRFASLASLSDPAKLFARIRGNHGKLTNKGATTYNGQKVVEIDDAKKGGKLYVAATGNPYPVAVVGSKKNESGTITFDRWNASVSISAPSGAIDISSFGG
jgi:hypothetical protein